MQSTVYGPGIDDVQQAKPKTAAKREIPLPELQVRAQAADRGLSAAKREHARPSPGSCIPDLSNGHVLLYCGTSLEKKDRRQARTQVSSPELWGRFTKDCNF